MEDVIKHRYENLGRSSDEIWEVAQESLENIQKIIREELKGGKKPEIPEDIEKNINEVIEEVINQPENNILIGVLSRYREQVKAYLLKALSGIAAELKRQKVLNTSIFTDKIKLALLAEMLIINFDQIAWYISQKLPIPEHIIEKVQKIATYHDYEFIDKFFNDDNFLAQQLGITEEEVREIFSRSVRLHFAVKYISDPLKGLRKVKEHLDTTLTDENIAKELGITEEEVRELFSRGLRLHFAVYNISDPLKGLRKWLNGEITTSYDYKRKKILKIIKNR